MPTFNDDNWSKSYNNSLGTPRPIKVANLQRFAMNAEEAAAARDKWSGISAIHFQLSKHFEGIGHKALSDEHFQHGVDASHTKSMYHELHQRLTGAPDEQQEENRFYYRSNPNVSKK